jgi:hypothetical protein
MNYKTTIKFVIILVLSTIISCDKKPNIEYQDIIISKKQYNNDKQYDYLTKKFGVITVGFNYDKSDKYKNNKIISNIVYSFIRKNDGLNIITVAGRVYKDNISDSNLKSLIRTKSSKINILQKEKIIGFSEELLKNPFEIKGLKETNKINQFEETDILFKLSINNEGNLVIVK